MQERGCRLEPRQGTIITWSEAPTGGLGLTPDPADILVSGSEVELSQRKQLTTFYNICGNNIRSGQIIKLDQNLLR